MSDETSAAPSAPSGDSISIDQAVDLYMAAAPEEKQQPEQQAAEKVEPKADAEGTAPDTDSGSDEATDTSAEGTDGEEVEAEASDKEQPAAPTVKPPASWAKDAQEAFAKLPPELQEVVSARERERETFANTKAEEAAKARKERDELVQYATQEVTKTLRMAQDAIEGEFAGIDWLALQASDPQTFLQLDAAYKQRMEKIKGLQQQRERLAQEQDATQRAQAQATLQEEASKVLPELKRMVGENFAPETFRQDLTEHLTKSGVPVEIIGKMQHGWELQLATKAMLYDKMQAAQAQATKKVASAPKVQPSSGKQLVADSGRAQKYKGAMARLEKTGSIDDAVAALRAAGGGSR